VTLGVAVIEVARREPDRPAIDDDARAWTYAQLAAAVDRIGQVVRTRLGSPGEAVGLLLGTSGVAVAAFLAVGHAGAAAMVLDPRWPADRLARVLASHPPALVITRPGLAARLPAGTRWLDVDAVLTGAPERAPAPLTPPAPEQPFYIGYTSGSTGEPKGFVRSHASWLRSFEACGAVGPGADDAVAVPGPLTSSWFLFATLEALHAGARVRLWTRFEPAEVVTSSASGTWSRLVVVPTMLQDVLGAARRRGTRLDAITMVISSGAAWPAPLRRAATATMPHAEVVDLYGSSEWSVVSVRRVRDDQPPGHLGAVVEGVELSVRDENDTEVAPGHPGVLWVRSPLLIDGYVGGVDDGARWDAEGFVAVGDLVRRVGEHLEFVGRRDDMIVCRGSNVYPEAVERVLRERDEVLDVAVVGAFDAERGEHLCALLELAPDASVGRAALRVHCRERLPGPSTPSRFVSVARLPRSAAGKLDRRRLAALLDTSPTELT
jgi:long-chain acyl-CoA synthetase